MFGFKGSAATKAAISTGVKSLQVKQILFLKSIADATYDSAVILRYIGKNLTFTPAGLAVASNKYSTLNSYDFNGYVNKKIVTMSGFAVSEKTTPDTGPQ